MMFPASLRMMAPLQARNRQLRRQNQELLTRLRGLQSKCQALHRQVAALQPLAGRVRPDPPEADEGEGPPPARRMRTTIIIN